MKKTILLILALLLFATAFAAPASYYSGAMYVVGCHTSVSLRAEPNTASAALAQIPRNEQVVCEPYSEQFARVQYNGMWGYVLTDYLDVDHEGDIGMYMWVANCDEWVSLRSAPSTSASRIAKLPLGTRVWVEGDENDFYCVTVDEDTFGYVLMKYLSPD